MKTFLTVTGVLVSFAAWALVWRDTVRSKQAKPWYVRHPIGWLKGFGTASMGWFALMVLNWDEIEAQERARKKAAAAAVAITPRAGSGVALAVLPAPAPPATVAALPDYDRSREQPATEAAPPKPAAPEVRAPGETEAWVMAKGFVKDALRSPSTADFGGVFDQSPNCSQVSEAWKCIGWVDARNGFGATVRNYFSVTIKWSSPGNWADPRSWVVDDGPRLIAR